MWHNPRALNSMAGLLVVLAVALLLFAGVQALLRSALFPLREVTVRGTLSHTQRADIERATRERVRGNFFAVELAEVRAGLERLPWVRRVDVRRHWPDRLDVMIEEHRVLARWGDSALINQHGERFVAHFGGVLPVLEGPDWASGEVARRYRLFTQLLAPLGDPIEFVTLSARHAWQLRLASGLEIALGREGGAQSLELRLTRFVAAVPQALARIQQRHTYVDLRYPNGFALRVPGVELQPTDPRATQS